MSKRFFSGIALAFVAALVVVLPAAASVTFDPLTGTGFVGKGDVQSAFGWNNQQLQANASGVSFTYIVEGTLSQTCEREAGASHVITRAFTQVISVQAAVGSAGRNNSSGLNGPNTGFFLTGFGTGVDGEALPTDICPNSNPNPALNVWHPVSEISVVTGVGGGLYVNYGGSSVQIW